ncbi:unnamed protein product, partial [Clonostachys solani]
MVGYIHNNLKVIDADNLLANPCFRQKIICKSSDNNSKVLKHSAPFNTLFNAMQLADMKITTWNSRNNSKGQPQQITAENNISKHLYENGLQPSSGF